ncbi:grasp-with-spasm system ATP-grasp peptide maturase [uncultured Chryseobacterium sp.]|uniref:grasp-with-spasm system ATP-grasp peptide maturase n=1 Tax=uncultured Chryseobacterium sp. TaxID=259322 RepID=UPI003748E3CB
MILIISHNHIDEPSNDIIDWLRYLKYHNFTRINGENYYMNSNYSISVNNGKVWSEKGYTASDEINTVFYRRWNQNHEKISLYEDFLERGFSKKEVLLVQSFLSHLGTEYSNSINALFSVFGYGDQYWLPNIRVTRNGINKTDALKIAQKNGIKIPDTLITTLKKDVRKFKDKHKNIITKPIKDVSFIEYNNLEVKMYTKTVTDKEIDDMPETFFPCLYQNQIDKVFELRVFFIEDSYYSMAIFSQEDDKTKVDFRNYNVKKPNRNIPFSLPKDIESKLKKTMDELGLNTGSIDLIIDNENNYIFLEVNPVGQLGMVSVGGNYNLEKEIAQKLIQNDTRRN